MRLIILLQIILFSMESFSQDSFAKELKSIINDSANRFQNFQGAFKESPDTALNCYYSRFTLEGTFQNHIVQHRLISSYDAIIIDSVSKSKGEKILEEWEMKLIPVLKEEFKVEERKFSSSSPFEKGTEFKRGNVSVFIGLSQYVSNESLYAVILYISYEIPK